MPPYPPCSTNPDRPVGIHYVDATHRYGVYLEVLEIEGTDAATALSEMRPLKPRVATVRKDEMAFIKQIDPATQQLVG